MHLLCVARKKRMEVYADDDLREAVQNAADNDGIGVSEWMREAARQKLQREELEA